MTVRFTSSVFSKNGTDYRIDIWDSEESGASIEFKTEAPGFEYNYPKEGAERFAQVMGSECTVFALNETGDFDLLITDILGAEQGRFAILIYDETGSVPVLDWAGWILPDLVGETNEPKPRRYNLTASDFAILKDIPYDNDGIIYTDTIDFIEQFNRVLSKTGLEDFWDSADDFLFTSVDWWDAGHPTRVQAKDPLEYTKVCSDVFSNRNEELDKFEAINCYEALKQLCKCWGVRIFQASGRFNVIQINNYADNTAFTRVWDKNNGQQGNANTDFRITIDQESEALIASIQNRFYPPLQKVIATYDYVRITNLLNPALTYPLAVSIGQMVDVGYLRFKGIIRATYTHDPANLDDFFKPVYYIQIKLTGDLGTDYYLKGNSRSSSPTWTTVNTDVYQVYGMRMGGGAIDKINNIAISFTTPVLPDNGDVTFKAIWGKAVELDDTTYTLQGDATVTHECQSFVLSFFESAGLFGKTDFEAVNEDVSGNVLNSYILDHGNLIIGDGKLINEGAVQVSSDLVTWVKATAWKHAAAGTAYSMTKLLCVEILAGQRIARAVMQGSIIGTMICFNTLVYDSKKWVFGGGRFSAQKGIWSGEWFEIAEVRTYITTSEEKNRISFDFGDALGDTVEGMNLLGWKINIDEDGNILAELPTSDAGLPVGALWDDLGTIKRVN